MPTPLVVKPGPLELLDHPIARAAGVKLYVKRDDLYSPAPGTALQGNKVRKLLPLLEEVTRLPAKPLLVSFGGAYSNHLSALATAGRLFDTPVVVYVRGEEVDNALLRQAEADGATLIRVSRQAYRQKTAAAWLAARRRELVAQFDVPAERIWFIPEGGTTRQGVAAMAGLHREITHQLGQIPDYVCLSAGTGGTAAGLILAATSVTKVEVYPALRGNWMAEEIGKWLPAAQGVNWSCIPDYHYGGYGKFPAEWIVAAPGLAKRANIGPHLPPLEPVYTAKLFSGVLDRIAKGAYRKGGTIVLVHTGGIY